VVVVLVVQVPVVHVVDMVLVDDRLVATTGPCVWWCDSAWRWPVVVNAELRMSRRQTAMPRTLQPEPADD
jgi:hypothetical protein